MSASATVDNRGLWASEATDVVRAASGGLLFGVPLLYTMEVWWVGSHTAPALALGMLAITFVPLMLLNRTSGFRMARDLRWRDALFDSVRSLAIGVVLAAAMLVLLRQINAESTVRAGLGKVAYEALPFCLGIGLARHFLSGGRDEPDDRDYDDAADHARAGRAGGRLGRHPTLNATLSDLGATVIGAVFVAITIAPTDEVPMVAAAMDPAWLLVMVAVSLVVTYSIVFVAGFAGQHSRHAQQGWLQHPSTETVACYLVSLACAALMLWVFQRLGAPWHLALSHVVVLGLPAAIGGAAGRLAV